MAAKTDKTHENGDPIWKYGIRDPKTGKITGEFEDTTEGAMNRFEAGLRPQVSASVRANIMKENAEQENKVAIMRSYMNASVAEKKIRGIDVTPIDKYLQGIEHRNSLPPEQQALIKDWMILDAAGIKQEKEWDIDGRTVPNEDGTYSYAKINKRTGDVKWEKIPGSSWKEHKKGTAADVEKAKAAYWPHDPEAPQHVNNARALFFAAIDGEQDPNKQRYMLNTVMPDFKDWAMEHSGEVDAVDKDGKKIKKPLSNKETRKWLEEAMKGYGGTPAAAGGKAGPADPKADKTPYLQDLHAQALKKQEAVPPEPPSVAGSESRKGLGAMRGDEAVEAVKEKLKGVKLVGPGMMERKRYQQPNE